VRRVPRVLALFGLAVLTAAAINPCLFYVLSYVTALLDPAPGARMNAAEVYSFIPGNSSLVVWRPLCALGQT